MLIVTINEVPGKKLEALGVVRGSTVQSRNLGHDLMAGFRTLVGGEVTDYADMLTEARQIATGRMVKDAEALGADAIVGMRLRFCQRHAGRSRGHCLWNGGEVRMTAQKKTGLRPLFPVSIWSGMAVVRSMPGCCCCWKAMPRSTSCRWSPPCSARFWRCCWCKKVFLRQPTGISWRPPERQAALSAGGVVRPDGIHVLAAVLYFAVFPHRLDLSGSWLAAAYGGQMDIGSPAHRSWA